MTRWKQTTLFLLGMVLTITLSLPFYQADSNSLLPPLPEFHQTTPSEPLNTNIHLMVIGDSGAGTTAQQKIANLLVKTQQRTGAKTLLHLGDLIYPRGDFTQTGNRLYKKYYQPLVDAGVTLKPVLGNHDVLDGYNPKALEFYNIPNRYYQFTLQQNGLSIDCFAIDTNIFHDTKQQTWLDNALKQSQADWKVVYGHHPVFSSGMHGNNKTLLAHLKPLLKKYQVDLYLAGHEHDYERFSPIDGTLHIVSGGGGAYLRKFKRQAPHSIARISTHHLLHLSFKQHQLTGETINAQGVVIDQFSHTQH